MHNTDISCKLLFMPLTMNCMDTLIEDLQSICHELKVLMSVLWTEYEVAQT